MSMEAAVVLDKSGNPIYWHVPSNRSAAYLPDSDELWNFIWEHRKEISGVAHSHPGSGYPSPSGEDITTFSAIERALGRRLDWWITTRDCASKFSYFDDRYIMICNLYDIEPYLPSFAEQFNWIEGLREKSYGINYNFSSKARLNSHNISKNREKLIVNILDELESLVSNVEYKLPTLYASLSDSGTYYLEWIFPDRRMLICIDEKIDDSSWHFVSKEMFENNEDLNNYSGYLNTLNLPELVQKILTIKEKENGKQ